MEADKEELRTLEVISGDVDKESIKMFWTIEEAQESSHG